MAKKETLGNYAMPGISSTSTKKATTSDPSIEKRKQQQIANAAETLNKYRDKYNIDTNTIRTDVISSSGVKDNLESIYQSNAQRIAEEGRGTMNSFTGRLEGYRTPAQLYADRLAATAAANNWENRQLGFGEALGRGALAGVEQAGSGLINFGAAKTAYDVTTGNGAVNQFKEAIKQNDIPYYSDIARSTKEIWQGYRPGDKTLGQRIRDNLLSNLVTGLQNDRLSVGNNGTANVAGNIAKGIGTTVLKNWVLPKLTGTDDPAANAEWLTGKAYSLSDPIDNEVNEFNFQLSQSERAANIAGKTTEVIGAMLPSIATSYITGSQDAGLTLMAAQAAGNAAKEAYLNGASAEEAYYEGMATGSVEYLTEMMFGGIEALGKGVLSQGAKKAVGDFARSRIGGLLFGIGDRLGENVEEAVSDWAAPGIKKAVYGTVSQEEEKTLTDALLGQAPWTEEGLVTLLTTMILGGMNSAVQGIAKIPAEQAQEIINVAKNTGDAKLSSLADQYQAIIDKRGKLSVGKANNIIDRTTARVGGAEAYSNALMQERRNRQQEAMRKAQEEQNVTSQFQGTKASNANYNAIYDKETKATFNGENYGVDLFRENDENMVRLTAEDGRKMEMTVDEALESDMLSKETKDTISVFDTLGENAAGAYKLYDGNMSTGEYVTAVDQGANIYVAQGLGLDKAGEGSSISKLSEAQKAYVEGIGKAAAQTKTVVRGVKGSSTVSFAKKRLSKDMNAVTESSAREVWGDEYENNLNIAEAVAKVSGLDIVFFDSMQDDGKLSARQGAYVAETGTMYLDIRAGMKADNTGKAIITRTMSHELTHYLEHTAAREYNTLKKFALEKLSEINKGQELRDFVNEKIARAESAGRELSYDQAVAEVVADACELMLQNSNYIEQFAKENRTVAQKIRDWISEFLKKLRAAIHAQHDEAKYFEETENLMKELSSLWDNALRAANGEQAIEAENKADMAKISEETKAKMEEAGLTVESGTIVTEENAELMRKEGYAKPADWQEGEQQITDGQESVRTEEGWKNTYLSRGGDPRVAEIMDEYTRRMTMDDAIMSYVPTGEYKYNDKGPLRGNVEYIYSLDFDTSCPRSFQFVHTRNRLMTIAKRPLTFKESINLMNVMKKTGQQIPCTYCYVENKRIAKSNSYNNWFRARNGVIAAADDAGAMEAMYGKNAKGEISAAARKVFDGWRKEAKSGNPFNPTAEENWTGWNEARNAIFNYLDAQKVNGTLPKSITGINAAVNEKFGIDESSAIKEVENFVDEWKYDDLAGIRHVYGLPNDTAKNTIDQRYLTLNRLATNYASSDAQAKLVENYLPYTDQIWNISEEDKAYINGMGGIRKHSSNDFRIDYTQDYMLAFADLAAGEWFGHTYTKNTEYVKIFGRTGDRINLSIAMDTANGKIIENQQEGASWKEARELRKAYGNMGVMAMVTDNAQLSFALNADWIDMIIPFHASGLKKEVWYNMKMWTDYTSKQLESAYTTTEMKERLKAAGITVEKGQNTQEIFDRTFNIKHITDEDGKIKRPHFFPEDTYVNGQLVPGHHNNAERYMQLCAEYGVHPRFYGLKVTNKDGEVIDITDHENYIKLVKETARTDTKQGPIQFNFDQYDDFLKMSPMDYAFQRMEEEAGIGGYENTKEDPYNITGIFKELYLGKNRDIGWMPDFENVDEDSDEFSAVAQLGTAIEAWDAGYKEMYAADESMLKQIAEERGNGKEELSEREALNMKISWDPDNNSSLKEQLAAHVDEVNSMYPVYSVKFNPKTDNPISMVNKILKDKFGYKIQRQDISTILFDETAISTLQHYLETDAENAALIAAPYVLKRGKIISGHKNHKGKGHPSLVFAAPVELNGEIGNVVVAALFGQKDRVHSLRVMTPDGKNFVLNITKDAESRLPEAPGKTGVGSDKDSTSTKNIPQNSKESNEYLEEFGTSVQNSERESDPDTLRFLNEQEENGDVVHTYKSFLEIDGKLYPPMASMARDENGKYKMAHAMEVGVWEHSVGNPANIIVDQKTGKGYYNLKKDNGKTVKAAYNPYQHSSNLMLNDQFEEAYQRPNLVTYECIIPKSELTSGYRAEYAKDAVGRHAWKAGSVAGQLTETKRDVYLSRWLKPIRKVPNAEVAMEYKRLLEKDNIEVPFNVVPPDLLTELENVGVPIDYKGSKGYQYRQAKASGEQLSEREPGKIMDYGEYNTREMQDLFNKLNSDETVGRLSKKVFSLAKKLDLKVYGITAEEMKKDDVGKSFSSSGVYHAAGYINFNADWFNDNPGGKENNQFNADTILHEYIHACTMYYVAIPEEYWNQLPDDVYYALNVLKEVQEDLAEAAISDDMPSKVRYYAQNIPEMLAGMSNPQFREYLKKRSLWDKIVDAFCYVFGFTKRSTEYTAVNKALDALLDNPNISQYNLYKDTYAKWEAEQNGAELSERDDSKTDRELLAGAFESIAKNDEELKQLKNYRKQIDKFNEIEKELAKQRAELRNLTAADSFNAFSDEVKAQRDKVHELEDQLSAQDRKLLELQAAKPLKEVLMRERQRVRSETRAKTRAAMDARQDLVKYRKQVTAKAKKLSGLLLENTNDRHVPENLKKDLATFLKGIDFTSTRALNGGEQTKADARYQATLTDLERVINSQQRNINGDEDGNDDGNMFTYLDISPEAQQILTDMNRNISNALKTGDTYTVNQMSAAELKNLSKLLANLYTAIQQENVFFTAATTQGVRETAGNDVAEMKKLGRASKRAESGINKLYFWKNATPYYAFKRYGPGAQAIFKGIREGQAQLAHDIQEIEEFSNNTWTPEEVNAWDKEIHKIELEDGNVIQMTTAQIMELAAHIGQKQSIGHMEKGGIRIGTIDTKGDGSNTINDTTHYHITSEDMTKMTGMLNDRQMEVAMQMQKYMAKRGGELGREVSMKRFGYDAFTEGDSYYPIKTDSNDRPTQDTEENSESMFRLLNLGATKPRKPKANNALVINSIFDTFSDHMSDMAKYHSMALPILDMVKYYNYHDRVEYDDGTYDIEGIQSAIEQAYGTEGKHYYRQLLRDLNSEKGVGDRSTGGFWRKLTSNYKVAAVAANLRVALLQPTAYVRASAVIEPKYLKAAFKEKNASAEALKYSGAAMWKDLGFYDTDIARGLRDRIKHNETWKDNLVEKSMKGAEIGDKRTWGRLWVAARLKAQDENPGVSHEELMKKTEEIFDETIYATQVMDSVLTRSELMRGKTAYDKAITAFMAEPTLSINLLMNAYSNFSMDERKYGKEKALQKNKGDIQKAFAVYAASATFSAIVESIVDAARDSDDDESFLDKFMQAFLGEGDNFIEKWYDGNLGGDLSILGKIPYAKTLISILQGFGGTTDMSSEGISKLIDSIGVWKEGGKTTLYGKIYKTLQALSSISGLPASSGLRDAVAIYNTTIGAITNDRIKTYDKSALSGSALEAYKEYVKPAGISKRKYSNILKDADADGDGNGSVKQDELGTYLMQAEATGELTDAEIYAIWMSKGWKTSYQEWKAKQ